MKGLETLIAVASGVAVGALAHFGQIVSRDGLPPLRVVAGYLMQTGLIVLVAAAITDRAGVESTLTAGLIGAVSALAQNEVINMLRRRARSELAKFDLDGKE